MHVRIRNWLMRLDRSLPKFARNLKRSTLPWYVRPWSLPNPNELFRWIVWVDHSALMKHKHWLKSTRKIILQALLCTVSVGLITIPFLKYFSLSSGTSVWCSNCSTCLPSRTYHWANASTFSTTSRRFSCSFDSFGQHFSIVRWSWQSFFTSMDIDPIRFKKKTRLSMDWSSRTICGKD